MAGNDARLVRIRDLAVVALKQTPLFRNASWRLLSDFVDAVGTARPLDGDPLGAIEGLEMLVVLEGRVQVAQGASRALLDPGIYLALPGAEFHGDEPVEIQADPTGAAAVFTISREQWQEIKRSFDLTQSLVLQGLPGDIQARVSAAVAPLKLELIWVVVTDQLAEVAAQTGLVTRLLLHFLAAGLSRVVPGDLIYAVRIAGTHFWLEKWRGGSLEEEVEGNDFASAVGLSTGPQPQRLLVLFEAGSHVPPAAIFHRVVYLHAGEGVQFPADLLFHAAPEPAHIQPAEAKARGFYASRLSVSLRATEALPEQPAGPDVLPDGGSPESLGTELRQSLGHAFAGAIGLLTRRKHFLARPLLDAAGSPSGKSSRIERDATRLELAVSVLLERWQEFQAMGGPGALYATFAAYLFDVDVSFGYQADKLGRAVAGKRVGIAVSGGGASAFRIAPLLELIGSGPERVDVDFFSGVSGGALVGAYYCALGTPGIGRLVAESERLQWLLPLLSVSSWPLEAWVDSTLKGRRVEDLTAPAFLAVTTELAGKEAPRAVVIGAGTLGEAVRASGSLPLGFGPTEKNGKRYTDGAAAALLPKQMLDDQADIILACNAVPGPKHSNPWYDVQPVVLAHDHTPVGRLIDAWTWMSYMLQNATRSAAYGADVFLDFEPDEIPMRDTIEWGRAAGIVADARSDPRTTTAAHDLYQSLKNTGTSTPQTGGP